MKTTLYHRRTDGSVKVWSAWRVGTTVFTEWGKQGGKMNTSSETIPNGAGMERGRAIALLGKEIARKMKKGYRTSLADVVDTVSHTSVIDFNAPLPRNFSPAKPIKTLNMKEAARWDEQGLLLIQRKRDGERQHIVVGSDGSPRIYSSGKEEKTEHLQPLLRGLKLPPETILDVELVVTKTDGCQSDSFNTVAGIARSKPDRAHRTINDALAARMKVELHVFDLLWFKGEPVYKKPYTIRYGQLCRVVDKAAHRHLRYMPLLVGEDLRKALALVKQCRWEGLVVWRADQATQVQVNGTPKRCNCYKAKLVKEEDVVAYQYELGKGRNADVVGKFLVGYPDQRNGTHTVGRLKFRPMGKCGTGLDDSTREDALGWTYPCVIQIEYDQKSESGFRFPVFIRKRDDKKITDL